jgi:predicted amidohydrolase YtcJ
MFELFRFESTKVLVLVDYHLSEYKKVCMKKKFVIPLCILLVLLLINYACKPMPSADVILINGKIVTVDKDFTIAEAVAISNDKIIAVGSNAKIGKFSNSQTKTIDLKGKTVVPGLIEAHLHPESASVSELDEEIPDLHSIVELLNWIKGQTLKKNKGEWIIFPKFFSTRMKELRQATLAELDSVAPDNPVFLNGSYGGMINSAAIKISGITTNNEKNGVIVDDKTGKLTGVIRGSAFSLLKLPARKPLTAQNRLDALKSMLKRYNRYGFTSLTSGSGDPKSVAMYQDMSKRNELTTRIALNIILPMNSGNITREKVLEKLKTFKFVTGDGDEWVKIGPLKVILDGGILTGTAYLQEPWGDKARDIFGIEDPDYRGVLNYTREELLSIVTAANELNWSFTAHSTGGGGVDLLLDVYGEVNKLKPIKGKRFSIIHGNFFNKEAIKNMSELGVRADMQPAWFYKDADAMEYILGEKRMVSYHPYRSLFNAGVIVNGGSDHMVKWDANTSINPYNPFLAMWTVVTRKTERGTVINPDEAITREEALKMYTINNAYATFEESIKGSIESGKLADMAILTDDILTCPVDKIKDIESVMTIVGGKIVYSSNTTF